MIFKHVLRNASIATITVLAVNLGFLISGTVVIEVVFNIPGPGFAARRRGAEARLPGRSGADFIFGFIVIVMELSPTSPTWQSIRA